MTIFRAIFCGVLCAFSVYGKCAYGIDYSREIDEGHGVGTRYKQPDYFHPSDPNCSACDKLEPGKTDWFVRVGNDIIYGAAACSHVASSHGDVIGGIVDQGPFTNLSGKFYVPSVPVSTNTIKHEYEKNGVHCWCRITKFNNTDFNKSSWIWISGGYSKYDWPLDESKYDKSVISEERTDFLAQHCGYFCAENCYMSMDEPTYRAAMYKTINVPDTGTRCITAVVSRDSEYIPICAGMYVHVEDLDGNERDTRTDGDGKFRLCDMKGNEEFFTLSQSGATCSLLVEDDASIADYIDTDSVLKLRLDCSHGSAEDNLKDTPGNANHTETQFNNIPTMLDNNQNTSSQHMKEKVEKSEKWLAERREKEEMLQKSLNPEQVKEAEDAYKTAKENETSLANRMLGGLTMAATGIGGMQLAQGLAEQNADKKAEQDMAAYLATFQCKVGDNGGRSYSGGKMGIEVAGANQLTGLYQQYVDLAASLKERKTALGMAPGIESQVIMDKANMGLYDATGGKGIENGTYASLYRASRGNETDAQKLAEQKNTSATRVKAGAIAAGAGVVGGAVGNAVVNSENQDDPNSDIVCYSDLQKLHPVDCKSPYRRVCQIPGNAINVYTEVDCGTMTVKGGQQIH